MKNLLITESEKNRILGMHKSATSNHYLMEQNEITITNFALIPEVPDPSRVTTSDGKTYGGAKITACGKSGTLRGKSNSDIPEGVTIYLSYSNDKDLVCTINGCSLEDTDLYKRMDRCK